MVATGDPRGLPRILRFMPNSSRAAVRLLLRHGGCPGIGFCSWWRDALLPSSLRDSSDPTRHLGLTPEAIIQRRSATK